MKYASIDLETTGLDPLNSDILEFGSVLDDLQNQKPLEQLPRFHAYILPPAGRGFYMGDPYALSMHGTILRRIATREQGYQYLAPEELGERFAAFLSANGFEFVFDKTQPNLTCAGKNFASFDLAFLKNVPLFTTRVKLAHRCFDPGSLFFQLGDERLPSTEVCCERAGLGKPVDAHTSIGDALTVIQLIRYAVNRNTGGKAGRPITWGAAAD